jgi:hypothetical protein
LASDWADSGASSPIVAAVAIVASVAIAVAGWLVSQAQARRATRRNMRIDYLLDAYRRLLRASNRPLPPEAAGELEATIGDVMLLGSPKQVELAEALARKFVTEHEADSRPLLLALRTSLRKELLLGELPQSAYVSLTIGDDGETVSESARIWRETIESTRRSVAEDLEQIDTANLNRYLDQATTTSNGASPSAVVASSARQVERLLRELLEGGSAGDVASLTLPQLANRAVQLGLIDAKLADSINGLSVMRILAAMDQGRLTEHQALEFATLATAIEHLLSIAIRATNRSVRTRQSPWH